MRIVDKISRFPAKYIQSVTAIDLETMVLAVAHPHPWLPIFFTQLADPVTPEPTTKHTESQIGMAKLFYSS